MFVNLVHIFNQFSSNHTEIKYVEAKKNDSVDIMSILLLNADAQPEINLERSQHICASVYMYIYVYIYQYDNKKAKSYGMICLRITFIRFITGIHTLDVTLWTCARKIYLVIYIM